MFRATDVRHQLSKAHVLHFVNGVRASCTALRYVQKSHSAEAEGSLSDIKHCFTSCSAFSTQESFPSYGMILMSNSSLPSKAFLSVRPFTYTKYPVLETLNPFFRMSH